MNKTIPILTKSDVATDHSWNYVQRGMSFDKNLNLTGLYCHHPFNTISIDGNGDVFVCICQAWLPISVGKIWEFKTLNDVLNSPKALIIQNSILDGSYRYCDNVSCSIINENSLGTTLPYKTINWINFSLDESCNLSCPSCRTEMRFIKENSAKFNFKFELVNHIVSLIEQHHTNLKFTLSGDGDPFASLIYRHFLSSLNLYNNNNIEIELVTNGILLKDFWSKIEKIHNNLVRVKISFDAGSAEVYNLTRRGGNWHKLLESVKYIVDWKKQTNSSMALTSNFVVQKANFTDMKSYVELCDNLGFDEINFQKIQDWGTFKNFADENIFLPEHPLHLEFLNQLSHKIFKLKKINFTNLTGFYHAAI